MSAACVILASRQIRHYAVMPEAIVETTLQERKDVTIQKISRFLKVLEREGIPVTGEMSTLNTNLKQNVESFCNLVDLPFKFSKEAVRLASKGIKEVWLSGRNPKNVLAASVYHILFECPKLQSFVDRDAETVRREATVEKVDHMLSRHFSVKLKTLKECACVFLENHDC